MSMHRDTAVSNTLAHVKNILKSDALTRAALDQVRDALIALANQTSLWGEDDFAAPQLPDRQARYLIARDDNGEYALYLNVMRSGNKIVPHDHTTWACIAAVEGKEYNIRYDRLDDGSVPGYARIETGEEVVVSPGVGIALMPDDIHSVEIRDAGVIRHLHLYGMALENLDKRLAFDREHNRCEVMQMKVATRSRPA